MEYRKPTNRVIKLKISFIAHAGKNFWARAPQYIPAIPPIPNRIPMVQFGATESSGNIGAMAWKKTTPAKEVTNVPISTAPAIV